MPSGDLDAFLAARWSSLFRLACLLTGSPADAQDLLQESMEKVCLRWTRIAGTEMPEAYVRRLMVNTLVSRSRKPFRRHELLDGELDGEKDPSSAESPERAVLDRAAMWPLVCALPVRQRAVIVLRYYEDLSEVEIAEALRCSTGSVKSQAHDALAALRRGVGASDRPEGARTKP